MAELSRKIGGENTSDALRKAVALQKLTPSRDFELNELAEKAAQQYSAKPVSRSILIGFVRLFEFIAFLGTAFVASTLVSFSGSAIELGALGTLGALLALGFIQGAKGYAISVLRDLTGSLTRVLLGLLLASAMVCIALYSTFGFSGFPGSWAIVWFQLGLVSAVSIRFIASKLITAYTKKGRLNRNAVIVGGGEKAAELIRAITSNPNNDLKIVGIFDDRKDDRSPEIVSGYPRLGTIAELLTFARKAPIDLMIVTLPLRAQGRLHAMLKQLWVLPVDIRLWLHAEDATFCENRFELDPSVPMLDVFNKPIANWNSVIKRVFDVIVASAAIVILSPILLITAIAVKIDSEGPIIFKQMREGFNNKHVEIFKFRSLRAEQSDHACKTAVTKGDSRVTKVGRFIRKTSIDELPQLFNVLRGDLSLVGPRPHVPNAQTNNEPWAETVDQYIARHKVRPGITGWAQINGWRGEVDNKEKLEGRVDADLYYIENWSIWFDIYILALTPLRLFNTDNAY